MEAAFDLSQDDLLVQRVTSATSIEEASARAHLQAISSRVVQALKYHPPPPVADLKALVLGPHRAGDPAAATERVAAKLLLERLRERIDDMSTAL